MQRDGDARAGEETAGGEARDDAGRNVRRVAVPAVRLAPLRLFAVAIDVGRRLAIDLSARLRRDRLRPAIHAAGGQNDEERDASEHARSHSTLEARPEARGCRYCSCLKTLLLFVALLAACSPGSNAGDGGADASDESPPSWLGDAGLVARDPVQVPLRAMCGIASNPGDFPLGADATSAALRQGYFDSANALGGVMIRRDFTWNEIEPAKGTFDFTAYDELVAEAESANVKLLGTLDYGVAWANAGSGGDVAYPPTDPQDYADYAAAVAARYAGKVDDWEIWNEPNNGFRFWKPTLSGDPAAYGALLEDTFASIHAAAPSAHVLLGGTVFTPQLIEGAIPWLEDAYAAHQDLATHFDVAGVHTYASYPPQSPPELGELADPPLDAKIQMHAWLLAQHGAAATPIWITEIGWPVYDAVDEATQARFTVRATLVAARQGASGVFWYTLRDGPNPTAFPPEDAFGLLHHDSSPKPVFTALQAMLTVLGDLAPQADAAPISLPDDARAVVFRGNGKTVVAAWTIASSETITWNGPSATVLDQSGAQTGTIAEGAPLALGPDVTYVVE